MGELNCCHDEIKSALNDKDMWVRISAVKALGHSLKQDAIKTIMPLLFDKEVPVVLFTIDAIAQYGDREAIGILDTMLNHGERAIREKAQHVIDSIRYPENFEVEI